MVNWQDKSGPEFEVFSRPMVETFDLISRIRRSEILSGLAQIHHLFEQGWHRCGSFLEPFVQFSFEVRDAHVSFEILEFCDEIPSDGRVSSGL